MGIRIVATRPMLPRPWAPRKPQNYCCLGLLWCTCTWRGCPAQPQPCRLFSCALRAALVAPRISPKSSEIAIIYIPSQPGSLPGRHRAPSLGVGSAVALRREQPPPPPGPPFTRELGETPLGHQGSGAVPVRGFLEHLAGTIRESLPRGHPLPVAHSCPPPPPVCWPWD